MNKSASRADFVSTMHVLSTMRGCTLVKNEFYCGHGALSGENISSHF